ncbi:alpha/beta fold hydrolase [Marinicella rhabdoformis]|uniref:alpha/beta fold hydrolase n=1 Tax=Marinicella rhabdoformis TaxID=2580566 RepID=UPI0012AED383|nr:alpha/beta hydrolase [Marinicella rhabdoformis]
MKKVLKFGLWLLFLLIVVSAVYIIIHWVPDRSVDDLKAKWAQPPSQFISVAGMGVHLRDEGPRNDKTPIVLLHGTSASLHTWDGWVDALKGERRVIRFDLPGFGLTGPDTKNDYTIENYAHTIMAVLDHLQVERSMIVGNSLGGHIAWFTALLNPSRFDGLVLVDATGYPFKPESVPIGFMIARIPLLNQLMENVLPRSIVESSVKNVYANPDLVSEELVSRYFDLTTRVGNRKALAFRLKQMKPGTHAHRIKELKLPTLIMWGEHDRLIPPEIGDLFHQDIVGSQLVRFEHLGHVPQEEDPAATVAVFKQFLTQFE